MSLTICDVSGLGTPCSPIAAAAPPPAAPLVAADELDAGLLAKVRDELEEGREVRVQNWGLNWKRGREVRVRN